MVINIMYKIYLMKKKIIILFCLFLYLPTSAWNSRGHMVIASIAYNQLSSSHKGQVTELLKHHPDYELRWSKDYKKVKNEIDLGEFLMMRASIWPDELGNSESPNFKYHRPRWHYINHIVDFENGHDTLSVDGSVEPNVVWVSEYTKKMVEDRSLNNTTRAVYLAWLIHLIGDIHQPQHCSSLYSSTFPEGDKGGNKFFVKPDTVAINLHGMWDGALGSGGEKKEDDIRYQSVRIRSKHSLSITQFDILTFDPLNWSLESFNHSINDAYIDGSLPESTSREEAPSLPDNYTQIMKNICEERSLLAGFRLGNTINDLKLPTLD